MNNQTDNILSNWVQTMLPSNSMADDLEKIEDSEHGDNNHAMPMDTQDEIAKSVDESQKEEPELSGLEMDGGQELSEFTIYHVSDIFSNIKSASTEVDIDLSMINELDTAGFQLLLMLKNNQQQLSVTFSNSSPLVDDFSKNIGFASPF